MPTLPRYLQDFISGNVHPGIWEMTFTDIYSVHLFYLYLSLYTCQTLIAYHEAMNNLPLYRSEKVLEFLFPKVTKSIAECKRANVFYHGKTYL